MANSDKNRSDFLDPNKMASLKHWGGPIDEETEKKMVDEVSVDCGWGRLIFGQTFDDPNTLADILKQEKDGRRDVAMYIRDPHIVVSMAPQELFLDPSLTYRLDFRKYKTNRGASPGIVVREYSEADDEAEINRIYLARNMVPIYDGFFAKSIKSKETVILIAEDSISNDVLGVVTGVDHHKAICDPDNGSSLWALAVDPQCNRTAVGEALVSKLIEIFMDRGRSFLDLSVMHDNEKAISLYEKLGFEQVPVYSIKNKNIINEQLYVGPEPEEQLNIYATIIIKEARRRGIIVDVLDVPGGFFNLTLGGRSVTCRESLSELTSAIAMSRCDDKSVTRRILQKAGLNVPDQIVADSMDGVRNFLEKHKTIVVKPARGEQGRGIQVKLSNMEDVLTAVDNARELSDKVLLEEFVSGQDLRIIVIDQEVIAAAVRRPAQIIGDGKIPIIELIAYQSRRRSAATNGESIIPMDDETVRCVNEAGYKINDILPAGEKLQVRNTANLHTGGTIHDVTTRLHPVLGRAAIRAAQSLKIPVVGFDFMVPDIEEPDYVIIEANERPGLANHEPQPTAEKFIDLLFPTTKKIG